MSATLDLADVRWVDGYAEAVFAREFDHSAPAVWSMLTDPAKLPLWLAPGSVEPKIGGRVKIDFADAGQVIDSVVTACTPYRLLEYSWGGPGDPLRPVRWTIGPRSPSTSWMTLTLSLPFHEDVARGCAGWEAHLEMLAAALEGVPIKFPFERFKAAREAYKARLP